MSLRLRRLAATTAGALAVTLTIGSTAPAYAQLDSIDPASLSPGQFDALLSVSGTLPLGSVLGTLGSVGLADYPLTGSMDPSGPAPKPIDESITEARYVGKSDYTSRAGYEYWIAESAAMKRQVILEVVPSRVAGASSAPVLYMLDGVDAPEFNSGWNHQGDIASRLDGENVHVVMPTGAFAAYYADWDQYDPKLGYNKWETFLTQELPGIVEQGLAENNHIPASGKAGIGGISMGGQAAMHLAATYPEIYQGVMSFSGYYSTMDALGYQTIRGTVETRGGNVSNLWGPHGSDGWKKHDTISHPGGLKNTAVYMSSGAPVVDDNDRRNYEGQATAELNTFLGLLLESGVLEGTREFHAALLRANVENVKVDYASSGLHNWPNFLKNFSSGWNYIKPALQGGSAGPGTGTVGSSDSGSSGSSGSLGS